MRQTGRFDGEPRGAIRDVRQGKTGHVGLNNFFALVVANIALMTGMTYLESFQTALVIILFEGVLFIILTLCNVRQRLFEAIPLGVQAGNRARH